MSYKSLIRKVKESSDIVKVISGFLDLKKAGINYVACCPFHNEKSPSFTVSPAKEIYKCFGCGEGGDIITFLERHEQISINEAVFKLAKIAKVDTSNFLKKYSIAEIEAEREAQLLEESILIANKAASEHFSSQMSESHFEYFEKRGLNKAIVRKFGIGYNPKNANLKKILSDYSEDILLKASLLNQKESRVFDFFYDERLMFPIRSKYGKIVAFAARTLSADVKPKYLNSQSSDAFDKSKTLYGFDFAKRSIADENIVFVVEGYTDVMMLHQLEISNSVAKCGTAFTESQAKMISKISERICFIPDSDIFDSKKKFKTLENEIAIALEFDLNVSIVRIKKGDVCEVGSEIVDLIELKEDAILFSAKSYFDKAKTPFERSSALSKVAELIAKTSENTQQFYISEITEKYKVAKTAVKKEVENYTAKQDTDKESSSDDYADLTHIKVLDSFYELSLSQTPSGATNELYVSRKRAELQAEFGAEYVTRIPRFSGLRVEPDHDDFRYIITKYHRSKRTANKNKMYKFVNWYNPLPYDSQEFKWENQEEITQKIGTTLSFLKHIFREKSDFGLDYLTIMYQFPLQKLPAIGFVSRKKGTGKSTFLDWTKEFYGANATMSSVDRITKNFNKLLEGKIVIVMEETKDENGTIENALKDMITNELAIIEGKGKDSFEVRNFVKVMFASNYETNCLKILDNEDRFAVFKVQQIAKVDNKMKSKLISEIPYFRYYLKKRTIQHKNETRLWFKLADYETKALNAIKESSMSPTIVLISELIRAIFLKTNLTEFKLSSKHLADYMNAYHKSKNYTMNWLTGSLKNENILSSKHATNFLYPLMRVYFDDWEYEMKSEKARYFNFKIEDYLSVEEMKLTSADEKTDEKSDEKSEEVSEDLNRKIQNLPDSELPF
jgi:DNA primase catalytic core